MAVNSIQSVSFQVPDTAGDERMNIARVKRTVDVSAMSAMTSLAGGLGASASALAVVGLEDGGTTGTGTTDIDTPAGDSDGWTDVTAKVHTMSTSASDLDADDYLNIHIDETGSIAPARWGSHASWVDGVPGGFAQISS
jgi:hypothetical protein